MVPAADPIASADFSLDAAAKKTLLRKIPHGLFICGVAEGDLVNGFTASWVTQGSFEPPLVVMAVRADSTSNGMIQRSGRFSLNVLAADQKDLAALFFKPQQGIGGRFDAAPFQLGPLGLPILADALGAVECQLVGQVAHGDHTVFVGEVKTAVLHRDGAALELGPTGWQYGG
ncbi:flavin reductase family protein [Synechococcus sp. CS-1325]|uniref:flavin reductase family protein n=1 Tax=unclassified Synechococcus TaxID=2626047 RepID=UPI000DB6DA99|nr:MULTISPECIES: flavin reductase family protein [unclassified Synechococcus]PZV02989.1 MAG: diguanylate cyclase [Cyanobium sp.]MCT0199373.1 flavin reductase family protein [Synechococcus sp. CS-1325]MCT0214430.1 flavin reductase family protein [Synechococcus sp. CS-1326]MCT0231804.1 flavin reductase family protein [Synechococcus sp. CS-1324]MCT0233267.1 flavin reductase family protein [Synechococcus sp. CS-1327]